MNEPGAEEGGEDIFEMPLRCVYVFCDGEIEPKEGFMKCVECGVSYGPACTKDQDCEIHMGDCAVVAEHPGFTESELIRR